MIAVSYKGVFFMIAVLIRVGFFMIAVSHQGGFFHDSGLSSGCFFFHDSGLSSPSFLPKLFFHQRWVLLYLEPNQS